jgi:multidrug efflux pump
VCYYLLGHNQDAPFAIKTMVVAAAWPGATIEDTLQQVTERLERTLQETPNLNFLRSFSTAGKTTIFVNLKQSTTEASACHMI